MSLPGKNRISVCCLQDALPKRGWTKHTKGYAIYTSRKKNAEIKRGISLHRAVMERLLGGPIPEGMSVQHLYPFNKQCGDPAKLMIAPPQFNPSPALRDPITGYFMKPAEYERRYGVDWEKVVGA
jgi:hypothetical protein